MSSDEESSNSLCNRDFSAAMIARQSAGCDGCGRLGDGRGRLGGGVGRSGGGRGRLEGGRGWLEGGGRRLGGCRGWLDDGGGGRELVVFVKMKWAVIVIDVVV